MKIRNIIFKQYIKDTQCKKKIYFRLFSSVWVNRNKKKNNLNYYSKSSNHNRKIVINNKYQKAK